MATPRYDNEYVNRREARNRLSIKREQAPVAPAIEESPSIDQLLREAKETYNKGTDFLAGIDTKAAIQQEARKRALENDEPSVFDSPATKARRLFQRIVRPIPQAAEKAALLGAMIGAPEVALPAEMLLGGFAGKRMIEGGTERLKEHPFMSAFDALMTIPLVRQGTAGARKLGSVLKAEAEVRAAARGVPMVPEQYAPNVSGYTGVDDAAEQFIPMSGGISGDILSTGATLPETATTPEQALNALMQSPSFSKLPKTATVANRARNISLPKSKPLSLKEIAAARAKERFGRSFRSE